MQDKGGTLLVSDQANGSAGVAEALLRHHDQKVRPPQRPEHTPSPDHLGWHRREVFKGKERHVRASV